jgi:hypothetical protein
METTMKTIDPPPALAEEFDAVIADLMKGVRDPAKMDEAARELDEGREEIRSRLGTLNVAVNLIRETRDE